MFVQHSTRYKDVPSWGLSDSFWERIKPFIPKPKSRLRGRGKYRKHIGGRPSTPAEKFVYHGQAVQVDLAGKPLTS